MASPWENVGGGSAQPAPQQSNGSDANSRQVAEDGAGRALREAREKLDRRESEERAAAELRLQQDADDQRTLLGWRERGDRMNSKTIRNSAKGFGAGVAVGFVVVGLICWIGRHW